MKKYFFIILGIILFIPLSTNAQEVTSDTLDIASGTLDASALLGGGIVLDNFDPGTPGHLTLDRYTVSSLADFETVQVTDFAYTEYNLAVYNGNTHANICYTNGPHAPPFILDTNGGIGYVGGCTNLHSDSDFPTVDPSFSLVVVENCYDENWATCMARSPITSATITYAAITPSSTPITMPTSTQGLVLVNLQADLIVGTIIGIIAAYGIVVLRKQKNN